MKSNWKTVIGAELLMTAIALGLFFGSKEFLVETWPAAATFTGYTSLLVGIAGFLIFGRSNFAWAFLTAGFMGIIGSFCSLSKIIPIFPLITFVLIIAGVALISIWKTSKRIGSDMYPVALSYVAQETLVFSVIVSFLYT